MKKNLMIIFLIIIVLALAALGTFVIRRMFFYSYYNDVVISNETEISRSWKEIHPPGVLTVGKENQFVSVGVEYPYRAFGGLFGIASPDGKVIPLEIKLIDVEGTEYTLVFMQATRSGDIEYASYGYKGGLPMSTKIQTVLMRSDAPIPAKRILWSGFNWKDIP